MRVTLLCIVGLVLFGQMSRFPGSNILQEAIHNAPKEWNKYIKACLFVRMNKSGYKEKYGVQNALFLQKQHAAMFLKIYNQIFSVVELPSLVTKASGNIIVDLFQCFINGIGNYYYLEYCLHM